MKNFSIDLNDNTVQGQYIEIPPFGRNDISNLGNRVEHEAAEPPHAPPPTIKTHRHFEAKREIS